MKITLGQLRAIIREVLRESGGGVSRPPQPYTRNALSPDINNREAIGRLQTGTPDEELTSHLVEPEVDPEDCWGPVPPTAEDPHVWQDPFVKWHSPLPTPSIKR
jgi:hypothetical protein